MASGLLLPDWFSTQSGAPSGAPSLGSGSNFAINQDTATGNMYFWNLHTSAWVQFATGALYTPSFTSKTANYTLTGTDTGILGDATSGPITLTLPTAIGNTSLYYLAKKDSAANNVTVATTSSQTINGVTTQVLSAQYQGIVVLSDGANWRIVSQMPVGGGGGGGTTLLAAVAGTDGATAAVNASYASLNTPWSASITIASTSDIIIEVQASWFTSSNATTQWGIYRAGSKIFNTSLLYIGEDPSLFSITSYFRWVDKAVAAGTYTYEIKPGSANNITITLNNTQVTTPGLTVAGSKGGSMMTISAGANV